MPSPVDPSVLASVQLDAVRRLPFSRKTTTNLFVIDDVLRSGTALQAHRQAIPIDRDSVAVFADDEPGSNWAHDCRYVLYEHATGRRYREVSARFPPFLVKPPPQFKAFHEPVTLRPPPTQHLHLPPIIKLPLRVRDGRRFAILYSGASNNRHVNDLEFLYRVLVDHYAFDPNDIQVLNYDGTVAWSGSPAPGTWPGDGTAYRMKVTGQGTKADLEKALDGVKAKITSKDLLLIHTNNHGGHDGTQSYLCVFSGPDYTASDFATKLATFPTYSDLMVMMEQCHSGGFNDVVVEKSTATRTTFAAAATEHRSSIGGPEFDPFARDWIAAMAGADPFGAALASNPDTTADGKVAAIEAFQYADSVHDAYDTPVYTDRGDADSQHLNQRWRWLFPFKSVVATELEALKVRSRLSAGEYRELTARKVVPALTALDDLDVSHLNRSQMEAKIRDTIRALSS